MLLIWQSRFKGIQTDDLDYKDAKKTKNTAFMIWLAAILLKIVIEVAIAIVHG